MGRKGTDAQAMSGVAMRGREISAGGVPFEVRCLRCQVTFPVETRRCIHCGGPTSAANANIGVGAYAGPIESTAGGRIATTSSGPISPAPIAATPTSPAPIATGPGPFGEQDDGELSGDVGSPPSAGAALLRSFGSLIWIAALIGFSMMKNCSEG